MEAKLFIDKRNWSMTYLAVFSFRKILGTRKGKYLDWVITETYFLV